MYTSDHKDTVFKIPQLLFYEHFVNLIKGFVHNDTNTTDDFNFDGLSCNNEALNAEITVSEIDKIVKQMKMIKPQDMQRH